MAQITVSEYTATITLLQYQRTVSLETSTDTTITITSHGLETGDFIVNTTLRSTNNAGAERGSRKVTVVDADTLTISPDLSGQTSGNSVMLFSFTDRTYQLLDGTLNMNFKAGGANEANFNINASKEA